VSNAARCIATLPVGLIIRQAGLRYIYSCPLPLFWSVRYSSHFKEYWCYCNTATVQNKLNALATFNVTGNEAKRNVVRSLAKSVDKLNLEIMKRENIHILQINIYSDNFINMY